MIDINIYFDLDGVLAHFDRAFFGQDIVEQDRYFDVDKFDKFVADKEFERLDPIEKGIRLLNRVEDKLHTRIIFSQHLDVVEMFNINIKLLGSVACSKRTREFGFDVASQKEEWLANNEIYHSTIFVEHRGKKKLFSSPTSILIDDCIENVNEFKDAGGYSIHFDVNSDEDEVYELIYNYCLDILNKKGLF